MSNGRPETRFEDVKRPSPNRSTSPRRCCWTGTLRVVRTLHPVLRADRGRSVHRVARTRCAATGRHRPGEPFQSYYSGNSVQICPVGHSPARPTDSGPGRSTWCPVPVCANTARADVRAHRPSPRKKYCAAWPVMIPRSTRSGTATRVAGRSPTPPRVIASLPADPRRGRLAAACLLVGGSRCRGAPASPPRRTHRSARRGRVTVEDAYAYSKFARMILGTNDIDFRARAHSAEEADFLAAHVAGQPDDG